MSRNDLNIEELFRSHMEEFTVEPRPGLWNQVRTRLLWKQFLAPRFNTLNVYYLAAALALVGSGLFLLSRSTDTPSGQPPASTISRPSADTGNAVAAPSTEPQTNGKTEPVVPRNQTAETLSPTRESEQKAAEETNEPAMQIGQREESAPEIEPIAGKEAPRSFQAITEEPPAAEKQVLSADFSASDWEGCAPLKVEFSNTSLNASTYSWTFGDGGSSGEVHPVYLFDEPGSYPVMLRARSEDGSEATRQHVIVVHETPEARFEIDASSGFDPQQPVYFYNYSRGAEFYAWDFGDQSGSELMEPIHYYREAGSYDIKLKVWTAEACYDSMILYNAFAEQTNQIRFPNAFSPNPTGPTGGYYLPNDIDNRVFHPVVKGEILEYQLKIYNRKGVLVFESNDLSIGWDGYYQEKLAAQGVYIYKARGRYSNGQPFVENGDLTLIHSR